MDPDAALETILDLARQILAHEREGTPTPDLGADLAEAVINLHEWITREGFLPSQWIKGDHDVPTPAQGLALAKFLRSFFRGEKIDEHYATVSLGGQGLSNEYVLVQMGSGYTGGIDRDGRVST
jgi:hypothetical protein